MPVPSPAAVVQLHLTQLSRFSHILDFDGWLYGRRIRVSFLHFLREEQKFDHLDALVEQIDLDIKEVRKRLL